MRESSAAVPPEDVRDQAEQGGGLVERAYPDPVRTYEYRDTSGKMLGTAVVELDNDHVELIPQKGGEVIGRRLRSLLLKGEKDGQPTEVDMMELVNPHGVHIFVADTALSGYHYASKSRQAVVPPLETPTAVAVLLHELGHADQEVDPKTKALVRLYGAEGGTAPEKANAIVTSLELLPAYFGRAQDAIAPDAAPHEVRGLITDLKDLGERLRKLDATDAGTDVEREKKRQEIEQLSYRQAKTKMVLNDALRRLSSGSENLRALTALPRKILERDATKRAYLWMREIRKRAGIDLFATHEVTHGTGGSLEEFPEMEECTSNAREAGDRETPEIRTTDVRSELKDALRSYRASGSQRRTLVDITKEVAGDTRRVEAVKRIIAGIDSAHSAPASAETSALAARDIEKLAMTQIKKETGIDLSVTGARRIAAMARLAWKAMRDPEIRALAKEFREAERYRQQQESLADHFAKNP